MLNAWLHVRVINFRIIIIIITSVSNMYLCGADEVRWRSLPQIFKQQWNNLQNRCAFVEVMTKVECPVFWECSKYLFVHKMLYTNWYYIILWHTEQWNVAWLVLTQQGISERDTVSSDAVHLETAWPAWALRRSHLGSRSSCYATWSFGNGGQDAPGAYWQLPTHCCPFSAMEFHAFVLKITKLPNIFRD